LNSTALVLAAHGSSSDSGVNEDVWRLAGAVRRLGLFAEVTAAFHLGTPSFATVLDGLTADDVVVLPLMTSEGHYSDTVLPQALVRNRRYPSIQVRQTQPIGAHPGFLDLVEARIRCLLVAEGLDPAATAVALVGHGTARHHRSRSATEEAVDRLRRRQVSGEVMAAFLDDAPRVATIPERARFFDVVVVPFLISNGPHAARDIPAAVGMAPLHGQHPPFRGQTRGRAMVCDAAVGTDPGMLPLIISIAREQR